MIKKTFIILLIVTTIALIGYIILPKPLYQYAVWGQMADGGLRKYQFSKYTLPDNYKMLSYRDNIFHDRKSFVLFQNKDNEQYYGAFILRELPKVKFEKVTFENKEIRRTIARYYRFDIATDPNFKLEYLIPFIINGNLKSDFPNAIIRNIKIDSKEEFETEKTKVLLVNGKFQKLGFYRVSKNPFIKYPVPVFSFKYPMNGSLAIINNKQNNETIFAFGCIESFKDFNKNEFKTIVRSITFDKEPRSVKDLFGIERPEKSTVR